ncbi:acetyltransferase [Asticcacaulis biprosthecium C19]|uniref:Acetyltransferase n=1 Tax=Asticcacaulis biprosthecium C19 TaxID=715226 RepID=F4QKZ3_9CAUL|nr:GNAT family N-acetyltransferase [Asticcacaulis biprosthecium]EGF92216.1 acetyltransferase [Asticcacaulis biprosthecium C19]
MTETRLRPTLVTPRLILRPPIIDDMPAWSAYCADPEVMRNNGGVKSRERVFTDFRNSIPLWRQHGVHIFSVLLRETGEWIGRVGPGWNPAWPGRELGWGLASRYWGRGYATEAATACLDFVFDRLAWEEVIHTFKPDHAVSRAVALRLGSMRRGEVNLPPPFDDGVRELWCQTRDDWLRRRMRLDAVPQPA